MLVDFPIVSALAAAAALGVGLWARSREPRSPVLALLPATIAASILASLAIVLKSYRSHWNLGHLATSAAFLRGYPLYASQDEGALLPSLYAPLSQLAFLPAALAPSPPLAIGAGIALALLFNWAPVLLTLHALHRASSEAGKADGARSALVVALLPILALALHPLGYLAAAIRPDCLALGLGAAATTLLALPGAQSSRRLRVLAMLLAALATWTKQPLALLIPVHWLLAWVFWGSRPALRFALGSIAMMATVSAVLLTLIPDLAFNALVVPRKQPLQSGAAVLALVREFAAVSPGGALLALAASLAALGFAWRHRRGLQAASMDLGLPHRLALAHGLVAAAFVPMSLLGSAKAGSGQTHFALPLYFALDGLLFLLVPAPPRPWPSAPLPSAWRDAGAVALLGLLLLGSSRSFTQPFLALLFASLGAVLLLPVLETLRAGVAGAEIIGVFLGSAAWAALALTLPPVAAYQAHDELRKRADPLFDPVGIGWQLARAHPGEIYLPFDPLSTLYTDGRLYNHDIGVWDREIAGFPVSAERFFRHVPAAPNLIAYPPGAYQVSPIPSRKRFEGRLEPLRLESARGWMVFRVMRSPD